MIMVFLAVLFGSIPAHAGEPWLCGLRFGQEGSIPAHAGEPRPPCLATPPSGVYPRACGGTPAKSVLPWLSRGLSPRMRGNRLRCRCGEVCFGSIPAHAGEPLLRTHARDYWRVYPRACGGTTPKNRRAGSRTGLSPRMRGNPWKDDSQVHRIGSIPAHAGEPPSCRPRCRCRGVYPRACGGTVKRQQLTDSCSGLSPRMRGNRGRNLAH